MTQKPGTLLVERRSGSRWDHQGCMWGSSCSIPEGQSLHRAWYNTCTPSQCGGCGPGCTPGPRPKHAYHPKHPHRIHVPFGAAPLISPRPPGPPQHLQGVVCPGPGGHHLGLGQDLGPGEGEAVELATWESREGGEEQEGLRLHVGGQALGNVRVETGEGGWGGRWRRDEERLDTQGAGGECWG